MSRNTNNDGPMRTRFAYIPGAGGRPMRTRFTQIASAVRSRPARATCWHITTYVNRINAHGAVRKVEAMRISAWCASVRWRRQRCAPAGQRLRWRRKTKREKALHYVAYCCIRLAIRGIGQCQSVAKSLTRGDKPAPRAPTMAFSGCAGRSRLIRLIAPCPSLHALRSRLPGA